MEEEKFTLPFIQKFSQSAEIGKTSGTHILAYFLFQERKHNDFCLNFLLVHLSSANKIIT